jgi:carbamoylphosphate synthase small subunit
MLVAIIGGDARYHKMFNRNGWLCTNNISFNTDLVCFTGGADVSPELYGQTKIPETRSDPNRDDREIEIFKLCKKLNIPMVGICRGGQFLNVMCGGSMWQDVDGHGVYDGHVAIDCASGDRFKVSSTHHQMMRPAKHGKVLAHANEATYGQDIGEFRPFTNDDLDTEVVLYSEQKILCFQPHPEYEGFKECTEMFFHYLENIIK